MIRLSDAREIILLARSVGIEPIVDGGWGVDALTGCLATQVRASTLSYGTWRPPPHSYRRPHEKRDAIRHTRDIFLVHYSQRHRGAHLPFRYENGDRNVRKSARPFFSFFLTLWHNDAHDNVHGRRLSCLRACL